MKLYVVYESVNVDPDDCERSPVDCIRAVYSSKEKAEEHASIVTYNSHYGSEHIGYVHELDLDSVNLDELKYKVQFQIRDVGDERSKPWYYGQGE